MAKFCSKCGMKLNEQTGKCPNCDEKTKMDTASSDSNISINGNPKEDQNIKKTNGEQEVKKESKKKQEESTMTKTMKIEGMMCGHCEARVKKTLEAIDGVKEAVVSHEAGTAIVTLEKEVADEVLKNAVEAQDYPVKGIE